MTYDTYKMYHMRRFRILYEVYDNDLIITVVPSIVIES